MTVFYVARPIVYVGAYDVNIDVTGGLIWKEAFLFCFHNRVSVVFTYLNIVPIEDPLILSLIIDVLLITHNIFQKEENLWKTKKYSHMS